MKIMLFDYDSCSYGLVSATRKAGKEKTLRDCDGVKTIGDAVCVECCKDFTSYGTECYVIEFNPTPDLLTALKESTT